MGVRAVKLAVSGLLVVAACAAVCGFAAAPTQAQAANAYVVGSLVYQLDVAGGTATLVAPERDSIAVLSIPARVKCGGTSYRVTKIGARAFSACKKLKKVSGGAALRCIDTRAFYGCRRLSKVALKSRVLAQLGKKAFSACPKLVGFSCPSKLLSEKAMRAAGLL